MLDIDGFRREFMVYFGVGYETRKKTETKTKATPGAPRNMFRVSMASPMVKRSKSFFLFEKMCEIHFLQTPDYLS